MFAVKIGNFAAHIMFYINSPLYFNLCYTIPIFHNLGASLNMQNKGKLNSQL